MPIAPDAAREWAWLMIALSLVAVVYVGLVAMVQQDMKKLVAYSSVAHMGFVTLGFFMFNSLGVSGAIVQMIAHGFVSAAMFLSIGVLYDRVHSREISSYGGVINTMPRFTAFALLFAMANCGLPGTAGFVGEWMVILGAVKANFWLGALAASALILARPTPCGCSNGSISVRLQTARLQPCLTSTSVNFWCWHCWQSPRCTWASTPSPSPM